MWEVRDHFQLFFFIHVVLWYLLAFACVLSYFLWKLEDQFWNIFCLFSLCILDWTDIICNFILCSALSHLFRHCCICYFTFDRTSHFMCVVNSMNESFATFSSLQLLIFRLFNFILNLSTVNFINDWYLFLFNFNLFLSQIFFLLFQAWSQYRSFRKTFYVFHNLE